MRSRVCGSARAAWRAVITARFINSSVTGFAPFMAIPSTLPVAAVAARQLTGSMRNCWTRRFAAGTAAGITPPVVPLHSCSVRASTPRTALPSPAPSSPESAAAFGERFQLCFAAQSRYRLCFANLVGSLLDAAFAGDSSNRRTRSFTFTVTFGSNLLSSTAADQRGFRCRAQSP